MKVKPKLHTYTQEEILWLIENINGISLRELTLQFNEKFNNMVSFEALRKWCYTHNIKKNREVRVFLNDEHNQWILDNYSKYDLPNVQKFDYKAFTKDFESTFGIKLKKSSLFNIMYGKLKIKMEFDRGHTKPQEYRRPDRYNIGDEKVCYGEVYIKVNDLKKTKDLSCSDIFNLNWRLKKKVVYEEVYNVFLNRDDIIIQLDGDIHNFEIDNLFHIRANELRCMSTKLWDCWDLLDAKTKKLILLESKLRSTIYKEEQYGM